MNKTVKVVIGAGYGDEGKGLFTQYFSSMSDKNIVIRFNGGAQAGHTIISENGERHVFGHFTANSFLKNAKGYLSKHFIVNPIMYLKELEQLNNLGFYPTTACHSQAYITTPYDMIINQWLEFSRGINLRHGSCGLGIGETVHRNEVAQHNFQIKDIISNVNLYDKMVELREFFKIRVKQLNLSEYLDKNEIVLSDDLINNFISDIEELKKTLICGIDKLSDSYFDEYDIVFEGAQGLLLDQIMGGFPHVTRSNTGLKNVIDICVENNISDIEVLYATRCYKTRHGAGVLKNELEGKPYKNIVDETNIDNEFQGSLRFAYIDIDELIHTIKADIFSVIDKINKYNLNIKKMIGVSCLDQSENIKYYEKNQLLEVKNSEFFKILPNDYIIYESWSADGTKIVLKNK